MRRACLCSAVVLFLSFAAFGQAHGVHGDADRVFALGAWTETQERVSLFCAHVTTPKEVTKGNSVSLCFLTEADGTKPLATNFFAVEKWDDHGLTAATKFTVDNNGNEVPAATPKSMTFTFRLVIDFAKGTLTKYVEGPSRTQGFHLQPVEGNHE
jgi:hypothetical protein